MDVILKLVAGKNYRIDIDKYAETWDIVTSIIRGGDKKKNRASVMKLLNFDDNPKGGYVYLNMNNGNFIDEKPKQEFVITLEEYDKYIHLNKLSSLTLEYFSNHKKFLKKISADEYLLLKTMDLL